MDFPYGERVRVIPDGSVPIVDPYAEDNPTPRPSRTPYTLEKPVPVFPATTDEDGGSRSPFAVSTRPTAFFPYDTDVREHDEIEVLTGPLAGTYRVVGRPKPWKNPFTNWAPTTSVELEVTTGA